MSVTNGSKAIKTIFQSVEMSVSLQSDVFDVGIEGSGQQLEEGLHLLLALPTLRASHDTTDEIRLTHLLSDSFGVMVAISEATAITLATICSSSSLITVIYWIIVVGVEITSSYWCKRPHQRGQKISWALPRLYGHPVALQGGVGTRPNDIPPALGPRSLPRCCPARRA